MNEAVGGSEKVWRQPPACVSYHRHSVPVCRVLNSASSSSSSCSVWLVCVKPFLLWRQHWWVAMSARWPWTSAVVRSPRSLMIRWQLEGKTWVVTVTLLRGFFKKMLTGKAELKSPFHQMKLKDQGVGFRRVIYISTESWSSSTESVMWHRHVSTVTLHRQTKYRLERRPFTFFCVFNGHRRGRLD